MMLVRRSVRSFCWVAVGLVGLSVSSLWGQSESSSPESAVAATLPEMHWRMIGPFRGGRTRAATGVPGQPNLFYVGQVDGGVWKSDDYGRTWHPIFDGQPTQSIGAIAVAPSQSNVIYVASGEGLHRPDLSVGDGIYRSADAGKTWVHLGLRDGQQIPALAVDPRDPNRLFAAVLGHPYGPNAERGIYRSTDGGGTWTKVLDRGPNVGGSQVVLDPSNPEVVYATLWESRLGPWEDGNQYEGTHGGLFKSTDGGTTWRPLTKGLPENLVQAQIAVAPSDEHRLYATVSTTKPSGYASAAGLGLYRSDDAGESWSKATDDPRPAMKIGGGDLPIAAVDPKNADVLYSASIVTSRSIDGGHTWTSLRGAPGGDDYQNLWINPTNPAIILLVSDQGAVVSVNRGESWSSWYNQPTAQLYHVATTSDFPYKVCAAQQESGSVCIASRGNDGEITFRDWHPAGVIEYGYVAPDPLHPEIVYGAGRTEVSKYNMATGQVENVTPLPVHHVGIRADRTEPILFAPTDPHRMYYAANILYQTDDYGRSWQAISPDLSRKQTGPLATIPTLTPSDQAKPRGAIYAVAASFKNTQTLWAGTDDGLVWLTVNGGKTWKDITPPGIEPWSKVTQISASHFDDRTAYISFNRMRADDLKPYVFKTEDNGATWQSIAAGLPAGSPVDTIREDPIRKGMLYLGTETAVWLSLDAGAHWQSIEYNLPHTSMRDLMVKDDDLIVATHGRSIWVLDGISALRQIDAVKPDTAMLFTPAAAWRVRRSTNTDTPLPADEPAGENPPDGAILDFWLPGTNSAAVPGTVALEVLDPGGKVIRRFASTDKPYATQPELARQLIPLYWLQTPAVLPATPGMHRWVWDLRESTPVATHYEYPISAVPSRTPRTPQGPLVMPGVYTIRLTAGGQVSTAKITVKLDPRVKATPADLAAEAALEHSLARLTSDTAEAALEAHSLREQIGRLQLGSVGDTKQHLETTDHRLESLLDGSPAVASQPGEAAKEEVPGLDELAAEVAGLYGQVGQADAAPTLAQQTAARHAAHESDEVLERWRQLKAGPVAQLNQQLRAENLPALSLTARPAVMPESGDED